MIAGEQLVDARRGPGKEAGSGPSGDPLMTTELEEDLVAERALATNAMPSTGHKPSMPRCAANLPSARPSRPPAGSLLRPQK